MIEYEFVYMRILVYSWHNERYQNRKFFLAVSIGWSTLVGRKYITIVNSKCLNW